MTKFRSFSLIGSEREECNESKHQQFINTKRGFRKKNPALLKTLQNDRANNSNLILEHNQSDFFTNYLVDIHSSTESESNEPPPKEHSNDDAWMGLLDGVIKRTTLVRLVWSKVNQPLM
jgi:hypothetical protein